MLVLGDSGLHLGNLTSTGGHALGFDQTSLLGIVEVGFGVALVWAAGPFPWSGRSLLLTLGVLALGFGIALAAFASSLAGTFGGDAASGWLFIGAGILTILAALAPFLRARAPQAVSADIEPPGVEEGPEIRPERSA